MSKDSDMTIRRYNHLFMTGKPPTESEHNKGWHYCYDWDLLLVRKGFDEGELCTCKLETIA